MELNIDEQTLIAAYRRLNEDGQKELVRFASSLTRTAGAAAGHEANGATCKIAREEARPEAAAEPIVTE